MSVPVLISQPGSWCLSGERRPVASHVRLISVATAHGGLCERQTLGNQTLAAAQTRETSKVFRRDSKLAVEAAAEPPTAPSDLIRARRDTHSPMAGHDHRPCLRQFGIPVDVGVMTGSSPDKTVFQNREPLRPVQLGEPLVLHHDQIVEVSDSAGERSSRHAQDFPGCQRIDPKLQTVKAVALADANRRHSEPSDQHPERSHCGTFRLDVQRMISECHRHRHRRPRHTVMLGCGGRIEPEPSKRRHPTTQNTGRSISHDRVGLAQHTLDASRTGPARSAIARRGWRSRRYASAACCGG